jgi:hypothetical protein
VKIISLARRAVVFEFALYRSLLRWILRRPAVPAGATPYSSIGVISALLWVFVVVSAVELFVVHVAVPWKTPRLVLDVLGVWGLLWMLGMQASFKVYPHLVAESGLHVRRGHSLDIVVPWHAIASMRVRERGLDKGRGLQLERGEDGTVVSVVIASRTNVDVTLRHPLVVSLPSGAEPITEIRFFADEASAVVKTARERIAADLNAQG